MHIKENLINFLYDKDYFISIYEGFIYVFNYQELISLASDLIILKMEKFNLTIKGTELLITKLLPNEVLIRGSILKVGMEYE